MPSFKGVGENVIAGLVVLMIVGVATWAASTLNAPVALWGVVLIAVASFGAGIGLGRLMRIGQDLLGYQADLIGEAILGLREIAAGHLDISFEEFIERGVLAPARFGISALRGEEIRLSVVELDEEAQVFRMLWESGHSLGRKANFSLPRASLAGHALESGNLQWTNNVDADDRWSPHPKADSNRRYRSLACMPIIVGGTPVAVLNVVSSHKGAFLTGDLTYIELLGGFIGLAWAMHEDAESSHRLGVSEGPSASERKEN